MGAGYNYTAKYKTFNSLLDEVKVDFSSYDLENMIEPAQLIKVAKRVNYDLGLRIAMTKETLLDVEKGRVRLPDNFYVLNFALICDDHETHTIFPSGTHIEERLITPYQETPAAIDSCTNGTVNCTICQQSQPCGCSNITAPASCPDYNPLIPFGNLCVKPRVFMNCKGDCYELVQIVNSTHTNTYRNLYPIKMLQNAESIDCGCPNLYTNCSVSGWIKDGWLYTTFKTGKVYINYQAQMEDDDGNLLVLDHDMISEYYEYALKSRILENLMMNDESINQNKIQLIEMRLKAARNNALSIVNMPNFSEMKKVWSMNRRAQYSRYYDMFKSYNWYYYPGL